MELNDISCCGCRDPHPDYVVFPCGHFMCEKCKASETCDACQRPVCLLKDTLSLQYFRNHFSKGTSTTKRNRLTQDSQRTPKARALKGKAKSSLSATKLLTTSSVARSSTKHPHNAIDVCPTSDPACPSKRRKVVRNRESIRKKEITDPIGFDSSQEEDVFIQSAVASDKRNFIEVEAVVHRNQTSDSSQSNTQEEREEARDKIPQHSDGALPVTPASNFMGFDDNLQSQVKLKSFMSFIAAPLNNSSDKERDVQSHDLEAEQVEVLDHSLDVSVIAPSAPLLNVATGRSSKKRKFLCRISKTNSKSEICDSKISSTQKLMGKCNVKSSEAIEGLCVDVREQTCKNDDLASFELPGIANDSESPFNKGRLDWESDTNESLCEASQPMELSRSCCDSPAAATPRSVEGAHNDQNVLQSSEICSSMNHCPSQSKLLVPSSELKSPTGCQYDKPGNKFSPKHESSRVLRHSINLLSKRKCKWSTIHDALSRAFFKFYAEEKPKSLARLAFDVLLLPLKKEEMLQGCEKVSPTTESALKSAQVDLFMEQTTVKVDLGREPAKRNSWIRRQLSFNGDSLFADIAEERIAESEDIVEGTPTKSCAARVKLLNDSVCSPTGKTLSPDGSPLYAHPLIPGSQDNEEGHNKSLVTPQTPCGHDASPPSESLDVSRAEDAVPLTPCATDNYSKTPRRNNVVAKENICPPVHGRAGTTPSITERARQCSFIYNDSESIIGDSEQIHKQKKARLALPLDGHNFQNLLEDTAPLPPPSPRQLANINFYEVTSSGLYGKGQIDAVEKLCRLMGAKFNSTDVTRDTTHLIIPEEIKFNVTTKFLMALYGGAYILPFRWVVDCLNANRILPEASYIPNHPGIKRRLTLPRNSHLFEKYAFHISPEILKNDSVNFDALKKLMQFCNCKTSETEEELITEFSSYHTVILRPANYSYRPPEAPGQPNEVSFQWFYASLSSYRIQHFDELLL